MDSEILWRVAVVQLISVAVLSLVLGLLLPHSFFDTWGWVSGPVAWLLCAWFTSRVVGLETRPVIVRAVGAGLLSVVFVLIGLHWLGAIVAVALFAIWCSQLPRPMAGSSP